MGQFRVLGSCAPGFQYDGALYKPGDTVEIPVGRAADLPYSTTTVGKDLKKVHDKLYPLNAEAAEMLEWDDAKISAVFPSEAPAAPAPSPGAGGAGSGSPGK